MATSNYRPLWDLTPGRYDGPWTFTPGLFDPGLEDAVRKMGQQQFADGFKWLNARARVIHESNLRVQALYPERFTWLTDAKAMRPAPRTALGATAAAAVS